MATVASSDIARAARGVSFVGIHSRRNGPFDIVARDADSGTICKLSNAFGSDQLVSADVHIRLHDGREATINVLPGQAGTCDLVGLFPTLDKVGGQIQEREG